MRHLIFFIGAVAHADDYGSNFHDDSAVYESDHRHRHDLDEGYTTRAHRATAHSPTKMSLRRASSVKVDEVHANADKNQDGKVNPERLEDYSRLIHEFDMRLDQDQQREFRTRRAVNDALGKFHLYVPRIYHLDDEDGDRHNYAGRNIANQNADASVDIGGANHGVVNNVVHQNFHDDGDFSIDGYEGGGDGGNHGSSWFLPTSLIAIGAVAASFVLSGKAL